MKQPVCRAGGVQGVPMPDRNWVAPALGLISLITLYLWC
jgi:hypothetical protein